MTRRTLSAAALVLGAALCLSAAAAPPPAAQTPPALDTRGDRHPHVRRDASGRYIFRNERLVAVLEPPSGEGSGVGPLYLYPATRPTQPPSRPLAVVPELLRSEAPEGPQFVLSAARLSGDDRLLLSGRVEGEGLAAGLRAELELAIDEAPWLSWRLTTSGAGRSGNGAPAGGSGAPLLLFPLRAGLPGSPSPTTPGRGAFSELLVPGVLYQAQPSAAFLDEAPTGPVTVEPLRLTVPLVALSQGGGTVGLMWDPRPARRPEAMPALRYDLPDAQEPAFGMALRTPPLPAGESALRIEGKLFLLPEQERPFAALRRWHEAYLSPTLDLYGQRVLDRPDLPRGWTEERRLSRAALLAEPPVPADLPETLRDLLPPTTESDRVLLLLMDAGMTADPAEKTQLRAEAERLLARLRAPGPSGEAPAEPLDPKLAYRIGGVVPSLTATRERVLALVRTQLATGAWPAETATGAPGARPDPRAVTAAALPILRYAALTGDSTASGSGMRAVEWLAREYGSGWPEGTVPGFLPDTDLRSFAEAVECFLLAYEITGERRYLETARHWADGALARVYFWSTPDRPAMRGASLFRLGDDRASQPTGLELARVLVALDRLRPDGFHRDAARALLASGMRQQFAAGPSAGRLPLLWDIEANRPDGPAVTPVPLLRAAYAWTDFPTEVSHRRLRAGPDRLFVASGAAIDTAETSAMRLRMNLRWLPGEETFATVTGVAARPLRVEYNSEELLGTGIVLERRYLPEAQVESAAGWEYDPELGLLLLRLPHRRRPAGGEDRLEVRWPDPKDRVPTERVDLRIRRPR